MAIITAHIAIVGVYVPSIDNSMRISQDGIRPRLLLCHTCFRAPTTSIRISQDGTYVHVLPFRQCFHFQDIPDPPYPRHNARAALPVGTRRELENMSKEETHAMVSFFLETSHTHKTQNV